MFIAKNELDARQLNDSVDLLIQKSIVSDLDGMFIQMDSKGYFNKG